MKDYILVFIKIFLFFLILSVSTNTYAEKFNKKEIILKMQKKLSLLGYNPGPTDGLWGRRTQKALKNFQKDNGLIVSGELDVNTSKKLGIYSSLLNSNHHFLFGKFTISNQNKSIINSINIHIELWSKHEKKLLSEYDTFTDKDGFFLIENIDENHIYNNSVNLSDATVEYKPLVNSNIETKSSYNLPDSINIKYPENIYWLKQMILTLSCNIGNQRIKWKLDASDPFIESGDAIKALRLNRSTILESKDFILFNECKDINVTTHPILNNCNDVKNICNSYGYKFVCDGCEDVNKILIHFKYKKKLDSYLQKNINDLKKTNLCNSN